MCSILNGNYNYIIISYADQLQTLAGTFAMENKTARFTVLIDPRKKQMFEEICAAQDLTPSQVVRQLIREYVIEHASSRELPAWLLKAASKKVPHK
jgi:ribbon-helix-helix protein